MDIQMKFTLEFLPKDIVDDKSILVKVLAWCHQVYGHNLNQSWPKSPMPYMASYAHNDLKESLFQFAAIHGPTISFLLCKGGDILAVFTLGDFINCCWTCAEMHYQSIIKNRYIQSRKVGNYLSIFLWYELLSLDISRYLGPYSLKSCVTTLSFAYKEWFLSYW